GHRRAGRTAPPEPARATGLVAVIRRAVHHRAARGGDRLAVPGRGLAALPAAASEPVRRLIKGLVHTRTSSNSAQLKLGPAQTRTDSYSDRLKLGRAQTATSAVCSCPVCSR